MLPAPRTFGGVEREVGIANHRIGAGSPGIADGNSDRCPDRYLMTLDDIGARDLLDQRPRKRFKKADIDRSGKHGLEFVAAETAHLAVVAHHRLQAVSDLTEQRVADRVTERIIDVLEAIEVDHEQR